MKTIFLFILVWSLSCPAFCQPRYAVIINEVMVDPSPAVSLPGYEWVELKNISSVPVSLRNWQLADDAGRSGLMTEFILQPDSLVILCSNGASTAMAAYGRVLAVGGFPSLDNESGTLSLISANGTVVHALHYSSSWHANELKRQGGWSLEMIDANCPCAGRSNWTSSIGVSGGSPGSLNSTAMHNPDEAPPHLLKSYNLDRNTIVLEFDEPLDERSAVDLGNYSIDGIDITAVTSLAPLFDKVELRLSTELDSSVVYVVKVKSIKDCKGNVMDIGEVKTGVAMPAREAQIIINEILFNPVPSCFDYVEIFNKGPTIVDASQLSIAHRNSTGAVASIQSVSEKPVYFFPGDYIVLTSDPDNLLQHYFVKHPQQVMKVSTPSYPDSEGCVVLLDGYGNILDEVKYHENWHFKLLTTREGVALERIDPERPASDPKTWHSASESAGFGTPTYRNSQWLNEAPLSAMIAIDPPVFSPDGDGVNDLASIRYKMEAPGYLANVMIFDAAGRCMRRLARNILLGDAGYLVWDGLGDMGAKLATGIYVAFVEVFNLAGKRERFKRVVVVAGRAVP